MASEDRNEAAALADGLEAAPYKYGFYQAARRLECSHRDKPRIGCSQRAAEDPVRFGQEPSLAFSPSSLAGFKRGTDGHAPKLRVNFFGLLGPHGPMPLHITEYVRDRTRNHDDETLEQFLDIFHHRMISLLYRAWAAGKPTVSLDRPDDDRFSVYVGSMFGMGMESFRDRDAVPDMAKLHFAGRLACPTRNAEGLRAIISQYFEVDAEVDEFVGHWLNLPDDCKWRLGQSPLSGSLGTTAVLGSRIWDCQQKFRVRLGPLKYVDYERLLPGTDSFRRLVAWVRNYVGDELSWDLHLTLKAEEVPRTQLGQFGRLGWSTWISSQSFDHDVVSIVSRPLASL